MHVLVYKLTNYSIISHKTLTPGYFAQATEHARISIQTHKLVCQPHF